jgi:hypothetical protein
MMLPHRRPRTVYRVCGEEEYLAGADPFDPGAIADTSSAAVPAADAARATRTDLRATAAAEARPRPALRRLAVGAALFGAAGGVGSAVGLALAQGHPAGRAKPAARIVAFVPARPAQARESAASVKPGAPTSRSGARPRRSSARRPAPTAPAPAAPLAPRSVKGASGPALAGSAAAEGGPSPRANGPSPSAPGEFGFER